MKRLNTRLDALESRSSDALTQDDQMSLVDLLARRDALFWPWRCTLDSPVPYAEIFARQADYLSGAVGLKVKADGKQDWKASHHKRQRLIASGFVNAQVSGGQVSSLFLTAQGEAVARSLVGPRLHNCETAKHYFIKLVLLGKTTECTLVRESVLFSRTCNGSPSDWDHDTEMLLPLLTAGMVRAIPDTVGRILYKPVAGVEFPEHIDMPNGTSSDFEDLYLASFDAERQALETCEPRNANELFIPAPACSSVAPHFDFYKGNPDETI
ncbi:MAG: hypothetical protein MUC43_00110 [Pirellula sp.]|nr:hypothetical protein [Pirellula sp.]